VKPLLEPAALRRRVAEFERELARPPDPGAADAFAGLLADQVEVHAAALGEIALAAPTEGPSKEARRWLAEAVYQLEVAVVLLRGGTR